MESTLKNIDLTDIFLRGLQLLLIIVLVFGIFFSGYKLFIQPFIYKRICKKTGFDDYKKNFNIPYIKAEEGYIVCCNHSISDNHLVIDENTYCEGVKK